MTKHFLSLSPSHLPKTKTLLSLDQIELVKSFNPARGVKIYTANSDAPFYAEETLEIIQELFTRASVPAITVTDARDSGVTAAHPVHETVLISIPHIKSIVKDGMSYPKIETTHGNNVEIRHEEYGSVLQALERAGVKILSPQPAQAAAAFRPSAKGGPKAR
jgi:hypothetical protein